MDYKKLEEHFSELTFASWQWDFIIKNKEIIELSLDNDSTKLRFKYDGEDRKVFEIEHSIGNDHGIFKLLEVLGISIGDF